jgi:Na+/H+-dicarboxylate symporter
MFGMAAGILTGAAAWHFDAGTFVGDWIAPWGRVFLRLLQMVAVPLVFVTIVKGVAGLGSMETFSRLGVRTVLLYVCFITASVAFGLGLGMVVRPGALVDPQSAAAIRERYETGAAHRAAAAEHAAEGRGPLAFIEDIVPGNVVRAASDNANMLQVIFFALLLAAALLIIPKDKSHPVLQVVDGLDAAILKVVDFIIRLAPAGVAALMAGLVCDFGGDAGVFGALGMYAATVAVAMLAIMFVFYPLVILFFARGVTAAQFVRGMYPVQLFAFTTSSSAATLPVNLDAVGRKLGVRDEVASFVLPVGVTVNMDGTACYQAIAILFIAQATGIELTAAGLLTVLVMTVLASIGTPGIPGGTYVVLAMTLMTVGLPAEGGLALIIGIDRPLDMLRTAVNVTGDATVACLVDRRRKPKPEK